MPPLVHAAMLCVILRVLCSCKRHACISCPASNASLREHRYTFVGAELVHSGRAGHRPCLAVSSGLPQARPHEGIVKGKPVHQ